MWARIPGLGITGAAWSALWITSRQLQSPQRTLSRELSKLHRLLQPRARRTCFQTPPCPASSEMPANAKGGLMLDCEATQGVISTGLSPRPPNSVSLSAEHFFQTSLSAPIFPERSGFPRASWSYAQWTNHSVWVLTL